MANTKVTGDVIANGTISTVHIADDAITAAKLDSTATGITFADLAVDTDTLYVDSSNNRVGIGTSSPGNRLSVSGNIGTSGVVLFDDGNGINFGNSNAKIYGSSASGIQFNASGSEAMRLNQSGNLGIGTTSPDGIFKAVSGTSPNAAQILIGYNSTSENYFDANTQIFRNGSYAEKMRLDSSGNLGIGTSTNISSPLTVQTDGSANSLSIIGRNNGTSDEAIISFYEYDGTTRNSYILKDGGNLIIATGTGGSPLERMRIDSSGLATFKKSGTNARFYDGSTSSTGAIEFGLSDFIFGYDSGVFKHKIWDGADYFNAIEYNGPAHRLILAPSEGNVGIGTTSPRSITNHTSLTINGTSVGRVDLAYGGTISASLYSNNSATGLQTESALPLVFSTDSTERMRITDGGVFVQDDFHITSTSSYQGFGWNRNVNNGTILNSSMNAFQMFNDGNLKLQGYNSSGINQFEHIFYNSGDIFFDGSVGIGTTSPSAKLDVQSSGSWGQYGRGSSGDITVENRNTSVTEGGWIGIAGYMGNTANGGYYHMAGITAKKSTTAGDGNYGGDLSFWTTAGTGQSGEANSGMYQRMTINRFGSVGIGTTSPWNTLDVRHGTNNRAVFSDSSSYGDNVLIGLNDGGGEIGFGIAGSSLSFYTNVSERITINNSGNVGIGATSPARHLDIREQEQTYSGVLKLSSAWTGNNVWVERLFAASFIRQAQEVGVDLLSLGSVGGNSHVLIEVSILAVSATAQQSAKITFFAGARQASGGSYGNHYVTTPVLTAIQGSNISGGTPAWQGNTLIYTTYSQTNYTRYQVDFRVTCHDYMNITFEL